MSHKQIFYCKGKGSAKGYGCNIEYRPTSSLRKGLCNKCWPIFLTDSPEGNEMLRKSIKNAKKGIEIQSKKETRQRKVELMTKHDHEKLLEAIINSIVRMIDIDRGCISCEHGWKDKFTRQRHAGHRYSVKAFPAIRFNVFNIFKQCSICNNWLSGNETKYDKGILEHWGQEYLDKLEEIKLKYQELHLSIPDLQQAMKNATEIKKQILKGKYFGREEINNSIGIYKR